MYFQSLMCTFHRTIDVYRAPHRADDFGTGVPDSRGHSPGTVLVPPVPSYTAGPVVGGWKGKDKSYFDNASLIDSDSFQDLCRFPNLLIYQEKYKIKSDFFHFYSLC